MIADVLRSFEMAMDYGSQLLADIPEAQFAAQPAAGMNHPAWIAGHIALSFQSIGSELGLRAWLPNDWVQLFGTGSRLNRERSNYPSKDELQAALNSGRANLRQALQTVSQSELSQPLPDERYRHIFPTLGSAVLHILTVHTAVHWGQLSAWRRAVGLPPVSDPL